MSFIFLTQNFCCFPWKRKFKLLLPSTASFSTPYQWSLIRQRFLCSIPSLGLHKLRGRLRPCKQDWRKWRYAYMHICARYWFLCLKIIWTWKCIFFCHVLGCLLLLSIVLSFSLPCCAALIFSLFVSFQRTQVCSSTISQTCPSQSKVWFSFTSICRREKYCTVSLG